MSAPLRLLALALFVALSGCGGGGDQGTPPVTVPQGPPPVTVPNVVGLDKLQAESQIVGAGFAVGTETDLPTRQVAAGGVFSQSPAAGANASKGSSVNLVLATPAQLAASGTIVSDSGRSSFAYIALNMWVNALDWDATHDVLQVVTGNSSPANPSSVLSINPNTGAIVATHQLPMQALAIAVSPDGQYVYVGLDRGGGIQRLNAKTLALDLSIPVGDANTSIQAIGVSPTSSRTIAVTAWWLDSRAKDPGVAVFDDAVERPNALFGAVTIPDPNNPYIGINALTLSWSADGSTLYASPGVLVLDVTAQGVAIRRSYSGLSSGGIGARVRGNLAYSDGGQVYDLTGPVVERGRFPYSTGNLQYRAELLGSGKSFSPVDHMGANISGLPYVDALTLWASDLSTYAAVDSLTLYGVASATFGKLYAWGTDGLAWGDSARLIVGRGTFTQSGAGAAAASAPSLVTSGSVSGTYGVLTYQVFAAGATDILADSCSNLYVSTSGYSPFRANSVVALDPVTGAVKSAAFAGSEPSTLAVSDNCSTIYAGLEESTGIARINTTTHAIDSVIPLATNPAFGLVTARSLAVLPGFPRSVAAATKANGGGCLAVDSDVQVFDGETMRANTYVGPSRIYSVRDIVFGSSPTFLYAFNLSNSLNQQAVDSLALDVSGLQPAVSLGAIAGNTLIQDGGRMLHYDSFSRRLISQFGDVLDSRGVAPQTRVSLNTVASITGQCGTPMQAQTTDSSSGKIFFVTASPAANGLVVDTYDSIRLSLSGTASVTHSQLGGNVGIPLRVARSGSDRLAVVTSLGHVIYLQGSMLGP